MSDWRGDGVCTGAGEQPETIQFPYRARGPSRSWSSNGRGTCPDCGRSVAFTDRRGVFPHKRETAQSRALTVSLTPDLRRAIDELVSETGKTGAEIGRWAIASCLREYGHDVDRVDL